MGASERRHLARAAKIVIAGGNCTPLVVEKPWGRETTLCITPTYTMRRVEMQPNHSLSQQVHIWKDETYLVLAGSGRVLLGADGRVAHELTVDSSPLFLPAGVVHKTFSGADGLIILEASTSFSTDAIRLEDRYGRDTMSATDAERYFALLGRRST